VPIYCFEIFGLCISVWSISEKNIMNLTLCM
jgi:hypothetical protein